jgi:glycosyltransferase involved in cell wall biosynthesis
MDTRPRLLVAVTVPETTSFLRGQLAWFREKGYDVHLLASPGPSLDDMARREGVAVHAIPMRREIDVVADVRAFLRVLRLIARLRPQVVSAGTPKAGLLVGVAAFLLRVPSRVYVLRGLRLEGVEGPLSVLLSLMERASCAVAHRVVCVSPSLRDVVVERRLVRAAKTCVIGSGSSNGVEVERYARTPERARSGAALRTGLGIATGTPVIGFVGRLTKDKGLSELIAAHADLRRRMHPPPELLVVGDAEGIDLDDLPGVHVLGPREDVADCLAAMDVLALPTYREGFPNVVLEAACAQVPAVVTDATGSRDSVVDRVTGLIVRMRDPAHLAEALRVVLDDERTRLDMGRAARRRAEESFRPVDIWEGLAAVYRETFDRKAARGQEGGRLERPPASFGIRGSPTVMTGRAHRASSGDRRRGVHRRQPVPTPTEREHRRGRRPG